MEKTEPLSINEFVGIHENIIDREVARFLNENKNKQAIRWDSYRNIVFKVIGFDNQRLVVLVDAEGNEIHISKKALYKVNLEIEN